MGKDTGARASESKGASDDRDAWLREFAAISESIRAITSSLELPEVLRLVLDPIKSLTGAEALSLMLLDPVRDELVFTATETLRERTFAGLRGEVAGGVAAWVTRTGRSARMDHLGEARNYGIDPGEIEDSTHNLLAVPVRSAERVIGSLELADRCGASAFTASDESALAALADALGARSDLATLASDPMALREFFGEVAAAVPSEDILLVLLDAEGRERRLGASRRLDAGFIDGLRLKLDQGIAGWVARHRQAVRLDDVRSDPRYYAGVERFTGFVPRTMICVPLAMKGRTLGVIQCLNKRGDETFSEAELHMVQTLADHAAIAIENASLYHEARVAALTDDLTGLSNTRHFNEVLPATLAGPGPVSLVVLDLDNFKAVVDTHGHLVGSRTIGQVGRRIAALLRPGDFAARFGGDEFVLVLPDTGPEAAVGLADRVRADIEAMDVLEDTAIDVSGVTASLGVASSPVHATTAESLFQAADHAMYHAKASRKNAVVLATEAAQQGG